MPLGQHKPIAVNRSRILRCDVHFFKIQISDDIRCSERSSRMPGLRVRNFLHDILPDIACMLLQFFIVHEFADPPVLLYYTPIPLLPGYT